MPGTNNPTDDELELVTAKIIEIANAVTDDACMLEPQGYFDECGFDIEARGNALNVKLKEWSQNAEDVEPLIEDHPQPRRMARYLLENVDYAILSAPLSAELLKKPSTTAVHPAGGGGGMSRNRVMIILALVVLLTCLALLFVLWPTTAPDADAGAGGGGGGGHSKMGRIRKGGGARSRFA